MDAAEFDRRQEQFWSGRTNPRRYDHPVVQAFARQRVEWLTAQLGSYTFADALDVGCGDGFGMQHMSPIAETIHGCDRSKEMLDANPADDALLKQCDVYELPYDDSSFELVYCWEVLHHIGDPQRVVSEMARVASRAVLLCEPNCLNPAFALAPLIEPADRGLWRFTPSYTEALLKNAGLRRVQGATVGWFTTNKTPQWLAKVLVRFPYRVPVVGMYTIALGYKETSTAAPGTAGRPPRGS